MIATQNLHGDHVSDAAAVQAGGRGIARGGSVGGGVVVLETTHGATPEYASVDTINPGADQFLKGMSV